ncbi:MAG: hypothetical protein WBE20_11135 [Candidatus Acidiferrales bacterium]
MKRGFVNQKLGKRNTRRTGLLKSKSYAQPSARHPQASKHSKPGQHHGG